MQLRQWTLFHWSSQMLLSMSLDHFGQDYVACSVLTTAITEELQWWMNHLFTTQSVRNWFPQEMLGCNVPGTRMGGLCFKFWETLGYQLSKECLVTPAIPGVDFVQIHGFMLGITATQISDLVSLLASTISSQQKLVWTPGSLSPGLFTFND